MLNGLRPPLNHLEYVVLCAVLAVADFLLSVFSLRGGLSLHSEGVQARALVLQAGPG